jgi:hypothetical protein
MNNPFIVVNRVKTEGFFTNPQYLMDIRYLQGNISERMTTLDSLLFRPIQPLHPA